MCSIVYTYKDIVTYTVRMGEPTFAEIREIAVGRPGIEEWGQDAVCFWDSDGSRAVIHRGAPGKMVLTGNGYEQVKVHFILIRPIKGIVITNVCKKNDMAAFYSAVSGIFGTNWKVWESLREARRCYRSMISSTLMTVLPAPVVIGVVRALEGPSVQTKNKRMKLTS
jgi:hypothetical protein